MGAKKMSLKFRFKSCKTLCFYGDEKEKEEEEEDVNLIPFCRQAERLDNENADNSDSIMMRIMILLILIIIVIIMMMIATIMIKTAISSKHQILFTTYTCIRP